MVATSGSDLIASDAVRTLRRELFPLAEVITPNRHEAEVLSGLHISGRADISAAARTIAADCGCAVLLKGGHSDTDADDLLTFPDGTEIRFRVSVSPTPTPTVRAALCPVPLRPTLPKGLHWKKRSPGPRLT